MSTTTYPKLSALAARAAQALTALHLLGLMASTTQAAEFNVAAGDVAGLAAAIVAANASSDCVNRIRLPAGTWTLTLPWTSTDAVEKTGLPGVTFLGASPNCGQFSSLRALEIVGAGMDSSFIVRAPNAPRFRFAVSPGGNDVNGGLRLSGLTLRGGDLYPGRPEEFYGDGGAVSSDSSTVSLDAVRLAGNRATQGGAINAQFAYLFITRSLVEGNSAARRGGAVLGRGSFRIIDSSVSDNTAGALFVTDASASGGGAMDWTVDGASEIVGSTVANNRADNNARSGGALVINNGGPPNALQILRSELRGNYASGSGGAMAYTGAAYLESSTVSGNTATVNAGAIQGGDLWLQNVTLVNSSTATGGSALVVQRLAFGNSVIGANRALFSGLPLANCNAGISDLASNGYNLDSDGSCRLNGVSDVSVFDIHTVLDVQARNHGGNTLTHALLPGGLAVDRGHPSQCRSGTDQRGAAGQQDGNADGVARCDIGAFELRPAMLLVPSSADTYVRTDLDIRRNDNYGLQDFVQVGSGRGGDQKPTGAADQMRALLRFNLSFLSGLRLTGAVLETRLQGFDGDPSVNPMTLDVHTVLPAPSGLWNEGNGFEGTYPLPTPAGISDPDGASGVAWAGAGNNSDPAAANNSTQPPFEANALATRVLPRFERVYPAVRTGEALQWDITATAQRWLNGSLANGGVLLRDPSSDGSFRGARLGSREGANYRLPGWVAGPRLVLSWTPGTVVGDFTGGGCVDQSDMALLLAVIRGQVQAGSGLAPLLDVNRDGKVDIADARALATRFTQPLGAACPA